MAGPNFGGWQHIQTGVNPIIVHVVPCDDDGEHRLSMQCGCEPRRDEESSNAIIHNSFDGREAFERRERLPS